MLYWAITGDPRYKTPTRRQFNSSIFGEVIMVVS
jgi:hypothetical protein